jgi:hypothetical protein
MSVFDALRFLSDHHIPHTTEGNRARRGWVQLNCPFCKGGVRGWDLGLNLTDGRCSCWRCGGKHVFQIIKALLRCGSEDAERTYKQYQNRHIAAPDTLSPSYNSDKTVVLPTGCRPLHDLTRHQDYLVSRRFDPVLLEKNYDLQGTGITGDYRFRVIAPIYFNGVLVSYQGRDITGLVDKNKRYKACAIKDEALHHKHTLYGVDQANQDSCVIVEGITDQWRLGPDSLATFGTGFTKEQATLLYQRYERFFILFDPEPAATIVAEELGWWLANLGKEVVFPDGLACDPGDLCQDDANALMRQMNLRGWNS